MVHDLSQDTAAPAAGKSTDARPRQAVAGLMPPELAEATIRECFPSVIARGRPLCKAAAWPRRTTGGAAASTGRPPTGRGSR